MPRSDWRVVSRLKVKLPSSKQEQQKIADFLSSVDTRIEQLEKKKSLLEQYKKGLMQKLFSQEIRFKDEKGEEYPEWEDKSIGDVSEVKRGASPRPITSRKWFSDNSNIGWVRISDVTNSNKYLTKTRQYLSDEGVKQSRLLSKGSMVMSICATIGKPIYIGFNVCIHDGFVVFENLKIDNEFLYYFLEKVQKRWYRYGQPGTQVNLNTGIVSRETIQVPNISEQQKIANFLSAVDEKIEFVTQSKSITPENSKRDCFSRCLCSSFTSMEKLRKEINRLKKHRLNYYESHCDVIERYLEEKPDISIESCKAILEGISKLAIHLLTQEPLSRLNSSNFDNLFKWALNAIEEKGGRDFRFDPDFIKRMGAAVKYLGEIRNQHSDVSHGRASLKEQVSDADLAEMVAGITDSIGTYMLRKLEQLNHIETDVDLEYSKNDNFNLAIDESHPIEGGLSYSKALHDQDPIGYLEWLENWRSEFNLES